MIEEMKDLLIFTEYIDWKYLVSLYHFAYAFVLLSIDEGFGRTPFEALACGCKKIILSDIPIFRETFKEDALFLPLYDVSKCKKICLKEDIPEVTDKIKVPFDILERNIPSVLNEIEMIK